MGLVLLGGCDGLADHVPDADPIAHEPSSRCAIDAGVRMVCQPGRAAAIPLRPAVTSQSIAGTPPAPAFGTLHDADYQLVAETIYGDVPPDYALEATTGSRHQSVLNVHCDEFDELYFTSANDGQSPGHGNNCGKLIARTIDLLEVSAFGPHSADESLSVMFSVSDTTLTLFTLYPYVISANHVTAGEFTVVERFVQVGAVIPDAGTGPGFDASVVASNARDPRCPSETPRDGAACSPGVTPLECEYGGDALRRCTTTAYCALQPNGSFRYQLDRDSNCEANAAACPASFGNVPSSNDAADGGDDTGCDRYHPSCDYPQGVCGCFERDGSPPRFEWTCRPRGDVMASPDGAPACPDPRPLAGDGCTSEGEQCQYDAPCSEGPSLGQNMFCQSDYWKREDGVYNCPEFP